jgi:radial spoke head protein 9
MYFRPVQQHKKKSICDRKEDIFTGDFLDNVAEANPKGGWTTTRDLTQRTGILCNRVWPGFMVFARANSCVFGNFYYGNGIKNCDLAFMI